MTRDDAKRILGEGATEEQISNLLNSFHNSLKAKEDENKQLKSQLDSQSDYNMLKSQLDEINRAKMTEQEKIDTMLKEAEQKLANANKISNTAKAKEILSGYNIDDNLLKSIVTDDETTTLNNANLFKTQLENYKETITKSVKSEISNLDIKPAQTNVSQDDNSMTREKFSKMTMLEQKQWKDANLDEYHEMFPKN